MGRILPGAGYPEVTSGKGLSTGYFRLADQTLVDYSESSIVWDGKALSGK